eukprot:CAMPEP_0201281424 /NCGR_PEP_ID=MMETSP1317-20130820/2712_1 /ASSEMBLY_ACC=CAM_ASM_000770 /TAXON_ID=187299 /ORGANISM="Undescribed Undescribed, Strain Undescribed" /LENGTH=86 /DNA_ID=CAMNT_0047591179 /DNA_START=1326 /DNA_END=1586 /DNA_ORIENTATION=+
MIISNVLQLKKAVSSRNESLKREVKQLSTKLFGLTKQLVRELELDFRVDPLPSPERDLKAPMHVSGDQGDVDEDEFNEAVINLAER